MLTGGNAVFKFFVGIFILFAIMAIAYKAGFKHPVFLAFVAIIISLLNAYVALWPLILPVTIIIVMVLLVLLAPRIFPHRSG